MSEVAEQTRISSLYLESIENDEYGILPGGIFNKGFVKSFAKFVGVSEQEALEDYSRLISASNPGGAEEPKQYRPEVLTDDRSYGSMMPTVIVATVILGLMTAGILYGLSYWRAASDPPVAANVATNSNASVSPANEATPETPGSGAPDMASSKVEFKAVSAAVSLSSTADGKYSNSTVAAGTTATFEPKEALKLSYSRSLASAVELLINGKSIALPAAPLNPKRSVIEFEINKDNLAQIWSAGAIAADQPGAESEPATAPPAERTPAPRPKPAATANPKPPTPRPSPERPRVVNSPAE